MGKNSNHGAGGRFIKGNTAAANHGNPYTRKAAQFRKALYECVTMEQFTAICEKMVKDAIEGTSRDREIFLTRLLGTPGTGIDLLERLEKLEKLLEDQEEKEKGSQ